MRILSVDDQEDNRYLVEALLKGHGFEVHSAAHGAEALALLAAEPFDLILSDILMPVMDGFELCRRVKADPGLRHIPLVVYTATYTGSQDEDFALKIGASGFVQKPCEPEALIAIIREVLAASAASDCTVLPEPAGEEEVLKLYSERLVRKLEQKMLQLEQEAQARRKTEEILKQSEMNYRSLFNSIRDAILVSDLERRIINCNQAFVDLFGYTLAEIAGQHTLVAYEREEPYQRLGVILNSCMDDPALLHHISFKKKDGQVFPGEVNVFRLRNDEGVPVGFIGLIRDVTERVRFEEQQKLLESQLHQAQKMESIGRLAGGVAHDYNNMLSVILGYAQIALIKTKPGAPVHDHLQQIVDAAQRSAGMTRQLLGFARKQTVVPRVLDLNKTVEGMLKMLRRLIGEDVALTWRPAADLWPVLIDPSQVDQIVTNLCVNARDAVKGRGAIVIETGTACCDAAFCVRHAGATAGEYVTLSVRDNGCGIGPVLLEKIFEPFFTTKGSGQGTGLGLAVVYGIVQQNKGFVAVSSQPDQGATFTLHLPKHVSGGVQGELDAPESIQRGQGETILVVEDEEAILRSTSALLAGLGYRVLAATRSTEAIRLAHAEPGGVRLLLADVVMSEMSGPDLAQLLLTFYPDLQCVFMSGYADSVLADSGVTSDLHSLLRKPFSIQELAAKVRAALVA